MFVVLIVYPYMSIMWLYKRKSNIQVYNHLVKIFLSLGETVAVKEKVPWESEGATAF